MHKRIRYAWVRFGVAALAVLAILLVAASAEAKFKVKLKSTPKARSAPSVSKPNVPDAPDMQPRLETGSRIPRLNVSLTSRGRGYFQRIWDWLFGRKPAPAPVAPAPAPAPAAPVAARPPGVAASPAAPATPPVIVPVGMPASAPASPASSPTAQGKELEKLPDLTPPPPRPEPVVKGYILHLKNGRRISTFHYEDKGDQVVIPQHGGTYGLSKSLIARIEVVKEYP
ncbi:MAG: hypothetical protein ACM362_10395 [Candidatus Methylomirabilota bacterium]